MKTDNPIRTEPVFAGQFSSLEELFDLLGVGNVDPRQPAEPESCDCGYVAGYLTGIRNLADHLLTELV